MSGAELEMPAHRANRHFVEKDMPDLSSLSPTLARVQRITNTSVTTLARKIGFAVGLEVASREGEFADVHSELAALFRKLRLGNVMLREWDPVIFATHNHSNQDLEGAFSEGILEAIMRVRSKNCMFLKHSTCQGKLRDPLKSKSAHKHGRVGRI
jgi:hypothetical protein